MPDSLHRNVAVAPALDGTKQQAKPEKTLPTPLPTPLRDGVVKTSLIDAIIAAQLRKLSHNHSEGNSNNDHNDNDDNDSNDDDDVDDQNYRRFSINPENPRMITQNKRYDMASFELFLRNHPSSLFNSNLAAKETADEPSEPDPAVESESEQAVIQTPREYQIELFEKCKSENTIVVLDTGSGKTLIAAMLLRYVLEKELEDRATGNPKKIAFFLVDKVALVAQQYTFLSNNLDFPMAQFCGESLDGAWSLNVWQTIMDENMLIICTAAVLQKALGHGFTRMDNISLIVFDEAHHAKKNHPYARIIKDHYIRVMDYGGNCPRIMGLTASPVDAKEDILVAMERLEQMLQSTIATVSADSLSRGLGMMGQTTEETRYYRRLNMPDETELCHKISRAVGKVKEFRRLLYFARDAFSALGPWAADRFWHVCLTESQLALVAARAEQKSEQEESEQKIVEIPFFGVIRPTQVSSLTYWWDVPATKQALAEHPVGALKKNSSVISSKVWLLHKIIKESFSAEHGAKRCIVFVEMRYTAIMLEEIFQQPEMAIAGLKIATLIGGGLGDMASVRSTYTAQRTTLWKFKQGELNCLFATSVAEEGIDIPQCDLVIRFDLYQSMIQYVQSKGRARQKRSRYINMAEDGRIQHTVKIRQARQQALKLQYFCLRVPDDRLVNRAEFDYTNESDLRDESTSWNYVVPESGATVTFWQALEIVSAFTASLPHAPEVSLKPEYMTAKIGIRNFVCYVLLPEGSPIQGKAGISQTRKILARCSAAFELCKELIEKGYIDKHLRPVFTKKLPAMRNARLAISANKKSEYTIRMKPGLWSELGVPERLFGAVLVLDYPKALGRPSRPLVLLTRKPLPDDLPGIPLFFNTEQTSARVVQFPKPLASLSDADTQALTEYTLRIFRDVFSKWYEAGAAELPYFLAPARVTHDDVLRKSAELDAELDDVIDRDGLYAVKAHEYVPLDDSLPDSFFENRFIVDVYDGSRKLFTRKVRKDLAPDSLVPEGVQPPRFREWKRVERKTIIEYSCSKWSRSRYSKAWRPDQPVFESELMPLRRNLLDDNLREKLPDPTCFVALEPLGVSTLHADTVSMAFAFPAIIHRLESHMITLEACALLGLGEIRPDLALEALTKDSDNTEEHESVQINLQGGMGANYERLEFLGDTFLKMATTISLYTSNPDSNEFEYHVERMLLICNQNLFNTAVDVNLQEYVRSAQFDRRSWYPQSLRLVRGKTTKQAFTHKLADKTIADVCEALIGAAYLTGKARHDRSGGGEGNSSSSDFDLAVRAVTAVTSHKNHGQKAFADYHAHLRVPAWQRGPSTAAHGELVRQLEAEAGYRFRTPALARSAFKHPSWPYDSVPHYQRLEFLGDSLLDMVCVEFLFERYPWANPQWLTEHKMAMVSNMFLGCLGVKLGFHRHLQTATSNLLGQIAEYATDLEIAEQQAKDAHESGDNDCSDGMNNNNNTRSYWLSVQEPPKAIADVVEAYVGAIFVDSDYDFDRVRAFFTAHVRLFFEDMALYDSFASQHPVTALSKLLQSKFGCSRWRLLAREVPAPVETGTGVLTESRVACGIVVHGRVVAHAVATNGRSAKMDAAKVALADLQDVSQGDFRGRYNCDCEEKKEKEEAREEKEDEKERKEKEDKKEEDKDGVMDGEMINVGANGIDDEHGTAI